jgi:glycosyltransferase involved in cell wall biosynthesis
MRGDLALKRRALRRAGATLAVSEAIAAELRAEGLPRVEVIPNIVDPAETRRLAEGEPSFALPERFVLFVGKLEENKGARLLVPALSASGQKLPLVVLGEGSLAHAVRFEATAAGIPLLNRGWAEREDVLRTLRRARALVFPALWPEPLSRVLLEALALGVPAAAMDTGGTAEILQDGSGLLARDVAGLGVALGRLLADDALHAETAARALQRAHAFSPATLLPRYEAVYRRLG